MELLLYIDGPRLLVATEGRLGEVDLGLTDTEGRLGDMDRGLPEVMRTDCRNTLPVGVDWTGKAMSGVRRTDARLLSAPAERGGADGMADARLLSAPAEKGGA